uniref:Uncharacterized protein n=1 Tax=Solanum lycopersicum TaxID=4081 RepID=A0A3Q7JFF6_SOLLC
MVDKVSLQCIRGMAPGNFQISQNHSFVYLVLVSNKLPSMEGDVLCEGQLNRVFMVHITRLNKHSLFLPLIRDSCTSLYSTVAHNAISSFEQSLS